MSEDFYEVLGVSRDADEDEIKRAYRKKAAEYHPDVSDEPDAEEQFKKIKKAKEVLTDDEKRRMYDQLGHEQFQQAEKHGATENGRGGGAGGPFGGAGPFGGGGGFGGGGFEDLFSDLFGGGSRDPNRPRQGRDLRTDLTIDLEEAYHGSDKRLTVTRPTECDVCNGTGHPPNADVRTCPQCDGRGQVTQVQQSAFGRVQQTTTCPQCEGEGELYSEQCSECRGDGIVREETTLTVEIPAGVKTGQTLRMSGEGAPGENRGPPGDLLIDIEVDENEPFERDGDDLHLKQPISFPQAVFGDTIEVETLDGTVEMDVPSGTQSGETFRLQGKGMPRLRRRGYGDLYVRIQIVTPESLNEEQREALEAFAEAGGEEIEVEQSFFDRIKRSL